MAMSLEHLLAEEGFKSRRIKMMARASVSSEPATRPVYPNGVRRTERAKSDISPYQLQPSDTIKCTRLRDKTLVNLDRKSSRGKKFGIRLPEDLSDNEIADTELDHDGVGNGRILYSNEVYNPSRNMGNISKASGERLGSSNMSGKNMQVEKNYSNNSSKNLLRHRSSTHNNQKSIDESKNGRQENLEPALCEPALDEVAIQAMISILNGYIKRYLKDEDFRTSIRLCIFSSLNFVGSEESLNTENKVIDNLEQAIETVERAVQTSASAKELKRASLLLSVITGLNAHDLKDGFTSGIPNSKLSACAHLYLSVFYKLQQKDRVAAKHLLQVFCDSPFPARTTFLPDLWDDIFLPHLSHLKAWYNQEVDSLADAPTKGRKLKLLEKLYNAIMDSGTYQFAAYYKDWLTEGVEAPSFPSIQIPSLSLQGVKQGDFKSHSLDLGIPLVPVSSMTTVSKKLYDSVFGGLDKSESDQVEDFKEAENYDINRQSSDGSYDASDLKDLDIQQDFASHLEDVLTAEESCTEASAAGEINIKDKSDSSYQLQPVPEGTNIFHELPCTKMNELTLKRLAKSVFEMQQNEESDDDSNASLLLHSEDAPYPGLLLQPNQMRSFHKGSDGNCDYFDGWPSLLSIPQDFICSLSGQFFEDPVTLETGQTFEHAAITEWFNKGHRTCPLTKKTLKYQAVPLTNFILKRVVDSWKSKHCRNLLAFASQIAGAVGEHVKFKDEASISILEHLLTIFSREERMKNAKLLISLGGLQFLIRRFGCGNLEEKTCIAALLSNCIEADSGCRNYIARNIEISCFVELLHDKQFKSRANAISLLTKLICLNRRKDVKFFLSGLQNEGVVNTMHVLLIHLQSCPSEQRPLVAALLLHLDLLGEPRKYSIYREEAVNAFTLALESSYSDNKIREKCCHALLVLGGCFSFSGKVMTEDWILKKAGFLDCHESEFLDNELGIIPDERIPLDNDDDEEAQEEWLRNLSASLLGDGKKSFLETVSMCLGSRDLDLVRVCLTTVAWLSSSLASLPDTDFQLSAFSALFSRLKDCLENGGRVEHKILASVSLLNFSKIPECRVLLLTIAKEMEFALRSLAEVTWTAKELYTIIFREDL